MKINDLKLGDGVDRKMKVKIVGFCVSNGELKITIKKPIFKKYSDVAKCFDTFYDDFKDCYLGCSMSSCSKYIDINFALRNFERDVKPYMSQKIANKILEGER